MARSSRSRSRKDRANFPCVILKRIAQLINVHVSARVKIRVEVCFLYLISFDLANIKQMTMFDDNDRF